MENKKKTIYKIFILIAQYLHNARVNCILDATFYNQKSREDVKTRLNLRNDQYKIIECICPEELVISRLTDRKNHYSDADISIYQKIRKIYEPIKEKHIIVETSHSLKTTIAEVVNRLQTMSVDQQSIILQLKKSTAYSHSVYKIKVLETHISWVLLTGSFVYKIKKEVKSGKILDFSTLCLRKKFCEKEYKLNRPLCGDMYQSVVKIIQKNGIIRFADLEEKGKPLEYAVKMIEIPQRFRMDNLVKSGNINKKIIKSLVGILVKFHNNAPTNNKISQFALPQLMKKKN